MSTRDDETPIDLAAAQADDELLDRLSAGEFDDLLSKAGVTEYPATAHPDDIELILARVLVAWRRDVDTDPVGELVDTDTALAAIESGKDRPWGPLAAVIVAAAVSTVIWLLVSVVFWLLVSVVFWLVTR